MRKKRLILNTMAALINQVVLVICAFVLPRMILKTFGSEVNGLVSSIQQFLAVISFMELGVGAVVQASLYTPLAQRDSEAISKIMRSANRFFIKLATGMMLYVVILLIIYPLIVKTNFGYVYTDTLILSMCISFFAQYFFGLKNQLLIMADQRGYIHYGLSTVSLIINNVLGVILLASGFSIQFVKLSTSLILLIRPLCLEMYVRKHYQLNRKIKYIGEPIKQKWNGVAQHVATVVLNSTDTIVLSLFSTLASVSTYNVYYLVVNGINNLIVSLTSGFQSIIGNIWAKKEIKLLVVAFDVYESVFHFVVTLIFGSVTVLLVPFVLVYTQGVNDVNYNVPMFGILISLANLIYCLRLPYNTLIKAAGHFKQTQNSAWIEMLINITISVFSVYKFGLIGVSMGTLTAMMYRTIYLVWYLSQHILKRKMIHFFIHAFVDVTCIALMIAFSSLFETKTINYYAWIILAIKLTVSNFVICSICNFNFLKKSFFDYKIFLR